MRCGAATTHPWPTDEELNGAYAGWYRPPSGRFSGVADSILGRARASLARRLDRLAPTGPVLDVGAGSGWLVDALRARGRETVGLERNGAREDFADAELDELSGPFAAVVFWHSLEHLRAPGRSLKLAAQLLCPGGLLVIAMPNAASLQALVFGDRWFALDLPRHLVHVPAQTLLGRLRALGLSADRVSYVRGGQVVFGWLHGLVGLVPGAASLYDSIRRSEARSANLTPGRRLYTLAAAVLLYPVALALALAEVAARRGGSVYVEASRA